MTRSLVKRVSTGGRAMFSGYLMAVTRARCNHKSVSRYPCPYFWSPSPIWSSKDWKFVPSVWFTLIQQWCTTKYHHNTFFCYIKNPCSKDLCCGGWMSAMAEMMKIMALHCVSISRWCEWWEPLDILGWRTGIVLRSDLPWPPGQTWYLYVTFMWCCEGILTFSADAPCTSR